MCKIILYFSAFQITTIWRNRNRLLLLLLLLHTSSASEEYLDCAIPSPPSTLCFAFVCLPVSRITQNVVDEFFVNIFRIMRDNKSFHFCANPDLDPVPGFF